MRDGETSAGCWIENLRVGVCLIECYAVAIFPRDGPQIDAVSDKKVYTKRCEVQRHYCGIHECSRVVQDTLFIW